MLLLLFVLFLMFFRDTARPGVWLDTKEGSFGFKLVGSAFSILSMALGRPF